MESTVDNIPRLAYQYYDSRGSIFVFYEKRSKDENRGEYRIMDNELGFNSTILPLLMSSRD